MPSNGAHIGGYHTLQKLDLLEHPLIEELHGMDLQLNIGPDADGTYTKLAWEKLGTSEAIGEIGISTRTISAAEGKMELAFLKQVVLWLSYQTQAAVNIGTTDQAAKPPTGTIGAQFNTTAAAKVYTEVVQAKGKQAAELKKQAQELINGAPEHFAALGIKQEKEKENDMAPMFPENKMATAEPVKLITATHLYQPVRGTGATSRYFVVGISHDIKVAARLKGTSVSIRLEGLALKSMVFVKAIKVVGLSLGKGDLYASMHVDAPDPVTAQKVVGSVLSSIPAKWETPMPSVQPLVGKGQ
jgi:hypothetical protein